MSATIVIEEGVSVVEQGSSSVLGSMVGDYITTIGSAMGVAVGRPLIGNYGGGGFGRGSVSSSSGSGSSSGSSGQGIGQGGNQTGILKQRN